MAQEQEIELAIAIATSKIKKAESHRRSIDRGALAFVEQELEIARGERAMCQRRLDIANTAHDEEPDYHFGWSIGYWGERLAALDPAIKRLEKRLEKLRAIADE